MYLREKNIWCYFFAKKRECVQKTNIDRNVVHGSTWYSMCSVDIDLGREMIIFESFLPLLHQALFFEVAGAVAKIVSSQKLNHCDKV